MDAERVLAYIDAEYLSQYTYRAPDFDFTVQQPRTGEATVYYEAMPGEETLCHMPAMMGSEDFANYAAEIPAVFGFIGCRDEANGMIYNNHHEKFTVNESLLPKGTALMAQFAVDYLADNA